MGREKIWVFFCQGKRKIFCIFLLFWLLSFYIILQGKPDDALKYYKEALEIFKRIGSQKQIEITLNNINTIKEEKKERLT